MIFWWSLVLPFFLPGVGKRAKLVDAIFCNILSSKIVSFHWRFTPFLENYLCSFIHSSSIGCLACRVYTAIYSFTLPVHVSINLVLVYYRSENSFMQMDLRWSTQSQRTKGNFWCRRCGGLITSPLFQIFMTGQSLQQSYLVCNLMLL